MDKVEDESSKKKTKIAKQASEKKHKKNYKNTIKLKHISTWINNLIEKLKFDRNYSFRLFLFEKIPLKVSNPSSVKTHHWWSLNTNDNFSA